MFTATLNNLRHPLALIVAIVAISSGLFAATTPEAETLAQQAQQQLLAAQSTHITPQEKQQHLEAAIIRYRKLQEDFGYSNPALYYNLGNAYARNNDLANAIIAYRRAELMAPTNPQLQHNLSLVRGQRLDNFPTPPQQQELIPTLLGWHDSFSFQSRLCAAIVTACLFWILAAVLLWRRSAVIITATTVTALVAIACSLSVGASYLTPRRNRDAVVVAKEIILRKASLPDAPAAMDAPIHAGTEVQILRQRDQWMQIQLPNRIAGWLPATALEEILPRHR